MKLYEKIKEGMQTATKVFSEHEMGEEMPFVFKLNAKDNKAFVAVVTDFPITYAEWRAQLDAINDGEMYLSMIIYTVETSRDTDEKAFYYVKDNDGQAFLLISKITPLEV